MSYKLVSRERDTVCQPMPWMQVARDVPKEQWAIQYQEPQAPEKAPDLQGEELRLRIAAIEAQAEMRVREAREAGRREGEQEGRRNATADLQPLIQKLAASVEQIANLRPRLRAEAEADLVKLAISIARRIVRRELAIDPEAVTGLVRIGLDKVRIQEVTRVRTHPDHLPAIREALAKSTGGGTIDLMGDPTQERGTVVLETTRGNLDVSVETQLREIERGLADRLYEATVR